MCGGTAPPRCAPQRSNCEHWRRRWMTTSEAMIRRDHHANGLPQRRLSAARHSGLLCAAIFSLFFAIGCSHRTQTSRNPPSPPLAYPQKPASPDVAPRVPVVPVPYAVLDDNAVPSPRVATTLTGIASWYGPPYNNRPGANGKIYDQNALTAAHRTLPMGTVLQVTNLATNQAVTVTLTDRGPFVHGRVLDLSLGAAKAAGVYRTGVAQVRIEILEPGATAALAGKWCVQVGAFLDRNNASRLQAALQRRYAATAGVLQFQGPTGYWVRVNPVGASRAQATEIASAIHTAEPGALPYLVRLD